MQNDVKKICNQLLDTFIVAGEISIKFITIFLVSICVINFF